MEGSRPRRGSPAARARVRTVPIAVTPEGFWCCPSPAALHKSLKNPHHHHHHAGGGGNKQAAAPPHKTPSAPPSRAPSVKTAPSVTDETPPSAADELQDQAAAEAPLAPAPAPEGGQQEPQHKICVGFGRPETSDLTVMLYGKEGIAVRMGVHRDVLCRSSAFFAARLAGGSGGQGPPPPCVEIHDCDDAEIYVETVGLMYCDEAKHRLLKQSVPRVLRIMKVAEVLGFHGCVKSCLDYLEAVPWVGEEEDNVVSSIRHLQSKDYGVSPLLRRITSDNLNSPGDTLANIMEMVLTSTDDRGRREMKALVLNLLKDSSHCTDGSSDICSETLYSSCQRCLDRLHRLFTEASEEDYSVSVTRRITLETDNLLWLVEMLVTQRICDDFVAMWSSQTELAELHSRMQAASRHTVSFITARLFVGIGRGEMLPSKNTRLQLLQVWLQALIDDYSWLQCSCRSFDRKLVEDGIGQTILTLPLEDQRSMLLSWFGRFLKLGDNCPNLQRAFEVWWRRTFVRPYVDQAEAGNVLTSDRSSS
ncbi:unnamed protein product [Urochloa decumbens]|uniref:At3g05675-like ankyrin-like domain-containing protein n=1 Tax=Urochloa decumbens TaxID=240449 RepID=A0ABC8WAJ0_9POAL